MIQESFYKTHSDYVNLMHGYIRQGLLGVELQFEVPGQATELHGNPVTSFASNDYLSLIQDPRVKEAGAKAASRYGTGAGSSMLGSGSLKIHRQLEEELAAFLGKEATILFPTGYSAMLGFASFTIGNNGKIYSDTLNHRSMLDGMYLGVGTLPDRSNQFHYFKHNDAKHLAMVHKLQRRENKYDVAFIEGVYSMDGDQGALDTIVPWCKDNGVVVAVDDAHGLGVLGNHGRGAADHFGKTGDVDFILGTFSKSLACTGGFCCGEKDAIAYMKANTSVYMFSASVVPVNVETARFVIDLLGRDDSLVRKLWSNIEYLKKILAQEGFDFGIADSAVIPVIFHETEKTFYFAKRLLEHGLFVAAVCFPVVKKGEERIRISVNAGHSFSELDRLVSTLIKIRGEWEAAGNRMPNPMPAGAGPVRMISLNGAGAVAPATSSPATGDELSPVEAKCFEAIRKMIAEVLPEIPLESVTIDRSLKDLGANSIDRVEVASTAMESLGLQIPRIEMIDATNLRALTRLFASKLGA